MTPPPRASALVLAAGLAAASACSRSRPIEAGFWFEPVTFHSGVLNGEVTPADLKIIGSAARAELTHAFAGLPITISDRLAVDVADAPHLDALFAEK